MHGKSTTADSGTYWKLMYFKKKIKSSQKCLKSSKPTQPRGQREAGEEDGRMQAACQSIVLFSTNFSNQSAAATLVTLPPPEG